MEQSPADPVQGWGDLGIGLRLKHGVGEAV